MADQKIDPNIRDLKVWLEARPKLYNLFVSEKSFGERVLTAFEYTRIAGKHDTEGLSLIETAAAVYPGQPIAGLEMLDNYIDGIKDRFAALQTMHEKQLDKSEAVTLLRQGHFEDFLLQSDAQFTETVMRLVPTAVQIYPREKFRDEAEFGEAFLEAAEFMIQSLGEGKVTFDSKTNEPRMTKAIGEILNQAEKALLRGFIEKKRPRTWEILRQFLAQKN